MPPDEPNEEEALEQLPEDGATPASLPDPGVDDPNDQNSTRELLGKSKTKQHPVDDDRVDDFQELYDEGDDIEEPNAGNAVEGYNPEDDQRRKN